jgi:hypothetical protein
VITISLKRGIPHDITKLGEWCPVCGQLTDEHTTAKLRDIYDRLRDGRSTYEALVFTSDWLQENIHDEEDEESVMLAMERDMAYRGLCTGCARPDLRNIKPSDVMSEEEAQDLHEMWAEQAAERRAGC